MSEKRFEVGYDDESNPLYVYDNQNDNTYNIPRIVDLLNELSDENEQLKQELRGMNELLESYRETIKHDAELLADATRNGYLPPLDDFVKRGYE